jgi:hypothetical protein
MFIASHSGKKMFPKAGSSRCPGKWKNYILVIYGHLKKTIAIPVAEN